MSALCMTAEFVGLPHLARILSEVFINKAALSSRSCNIQSPLVCPASGTAHRCLHAQVRGILDAQEAALAKDTGLLQNAHVCVATPEALADTIAGMP